MRRSSYLSVFLLVSLLLPHDSSLANPPQVATVRSQFFNTDFDPPGDDAPPDTVGAGSRSGDRCNPSDAPIRPLFPTQGFGLTLAAQPTLLVNLPQTAARQIVLTLEDEAKTTHDRTFYPIPAQPGIARFPLPDRQLDAGKNYRVSLILVCGDSVQPDDPVFTTWVQRVDRTAAMEQQIQTMTPIEQTHWYAEQGYWYDLVPMLHQLQPTHPETWHEFLEAMELQEF
jgi:hypothetical protein